MAMPTSLFSSSSADEWTPDVFLSFRGKDTRNNFTGHLYKALCEKGINTFMDDENLMKGEEITQALIRAIKESRIAIVIFSEDFPSSRFCLDELVMIMDCLERIDNYQVLPVFYKVTPADVRHQIGTFENALAKHETRISENGKVQKWKSALKEAANKSGWVSDEYGQEYILIEDIVEEVSEIINDPTLGSGSTFKQKVHSHDYHQSMANSPVMFGTSVQFSGLQTSPSASCFGAQSSCGPGFGATHPLYNVDIPMVAQFMPTPPSNQYGYHECLTLLSSTNVPNLGPQSSFNAFQCPICLKLHHPYV